MSQPTLLHKCLQIQIFLSDLVRLNRFTKTHKQLILKVFADHGIRIPDISISDRQTLVRIFTTFHDKGKFASECYVQKLRSLICQKELADLQLSYLVLDAELYESNSSHASDIRLAHALLMGACLPGITANKIEVEDSKSKMSK